jgi:acetolactate synthase I/III small subunit
MSTLYTISAFSENSPGVLHRITAIFTRRKINVESLCVSETETKGISRFTISIFSTEEAVRKIVGQIARIIEVVDVYVHTDEELIFKELAFFRVKISDPRSFTEIEELAHRYGAHMVYADGSSMVIEKSGSEADVDSLYHLFEPFGITEFVRSGRIAVERTFRHTPPTSEANDTADSE